MFVAVVLILVNLAVLGAIARRVGTVDGDSSIPRAPRRAARRTPRPDSTLRLPV
jgi:hypothetical protein